MGEYITIYDMRLCLCLSILFAVRGIPFAQISVIYHYSFQKTGGVNAVLLLDAICLFRLQ